jgi:SAM-dependent methyltransferase
VAPRTRGRGLATRSYGPLAEAYDIVHARKPYAREARIVRALARREARRPLRTLLDVACGSGRHLEEFARWFDCTGLDASPEMLARARRRVPSAQLLRGRMEAFDLAREFDVVTCLFSAIGYVRSRRELRRTIRNLARHTAPGGVVVVEPWLTPGVFRAGRGFHLVRTSGRTTVVRMDGSRRRGERSIFDFHYLVGRDGRVVHGLEVHDLGLFDRPTVRAAFRAAGLEVRYVRGGFPSGRGLWVGRRPVRRAGARAGRPTPGRSRPRAAR